MDKLENFQPDTVDQTFPTPEVVLEATERGRAPAAIVPTEETVLASETSKGLTIDGTANLRSIPIEGPSTQNQETKASDQEPQAPTAPIVNIQNPTPQVNVNVVISGKTDIAEKSNTPTPIIEDRVATGGVLTSTVKETIVATEKTVLEKVSDLEKTINAVNSSQESINTILKDSTSVLTSNTQSDKSKSTVSNSEKSTDITTKSIDEMFLSNFASTESTELLRIAESNIAKPETILGKAAGAISEPIKNLGSDVSSEIPNVRSTSLVDSKTVTQLLTPDRTIERSVSKLTRELPESINNLSTSVSSISQPSTTFSNVTNEGARIDQSTSIMAPQPQTVRMSPSDSKSASDQNQSNQNKNEFYLQAIYSALMSGKIRVKIESL